MGLNRKFTLAAVFTVASIAGLIMDKLSGGEFVAMAGTVLGLYGVTNVMSKRAE